MHRNRKNHAVTAIDRRRIYIMDINPYADIV